MARLFDLSPQGFRTSILPHLPADAVRKGRPKMIHARTAIEVWARREFRLDSGSATAGPGQEDLMLDRRFRVARAEREEMELNLRRGQLVDLDDFLAWYRADVAGPIRKGLERLQVTHGKAAADVVIQGLVRAEEAIEQRSKRDGG